MIFRSQRRAIQTIDSIGSPASSPPRVAWPDSISDTGSYPLHREGSDSRTLVTHLYRTSLITVLAAIVVMLSLSRLVGLEIDPPYGISTNSGALITDEGWYTKSAQSLAKTGELRHAMDRNIYTHTIAYTLTTAAAFELGGVNLFTARLLSVCSFWASLVLFYLVGRSSQPTRVALLGCLIVAGNFQSFAFSRLALAEPLGVAFSLGALYFWIKGQHNATRCATSLLLASLAMFTKLSFVFTLFTVSVLWISSIVGPRGAGVKAARIRLLVAMAIVLFSTLLALFFITIWNPDDWQSMQYPILRQQATDLGLKTILTHEYHAIRSLLTLPDRASLAWAAGIGLFVLILFRRDDARQQIQRPATFAMLVWLVCGLIFLSAFKVQPARYYYFMIFPLAFLALEGLRWIAPRRHWVALVVLVVALNAAEQIPNYLQWWSRGGESTYATASREIASIVTQSTKEEVALLGLNSSFVSLFDDRIRPLELQYVPSEVMCQRIAFWRPSHIVHFRKPLQDLEPLCPSEIDRIEVVSSYPVMRHWYFGCDMVLANIVYNDFH